MDPKGCNKRSPKANPHNKAQREEEMATFEVAKLKAISQCFMDVEILHQKGMCIFKGMYKDQNNKKIWKN